MTQQIHAADMFFATAHPAQLRGWEARLCDYYRGEGRMPRPKGRRVLKPLRDDYQRVTDELRASALVRKPQTQMEAIA